MIHPARFAGINPEQINLQVIEGKSVSDILFSKLIPSISIHIANKKNPWNKPMMSNKTWQCVNLQISRAHIKESAENKVELLLFTKSVEDGTVESFKNYQITKDKITATTRDHLSFECKFKINKGFTTLKTGKLFLVGLKVNQVTIKFLVTDIFVGSHQNQIKPPYNICDEWKKTLQKKTFWFSERKKLEMEPSDKKRKVEIEETSKEIKEMIWDDSDYLLFNIFPEAYSDIEGNPMLPLKKLAN
jgi:hypothetical protein